MFIYFQPPVDDNGSRGIRFLFSSTFIMWYHMLLLHLDFHNWILRLLTGSMFNSLELDQVGWTAKLTTIGLADPVFPWHQCRFACRTVTWIVTSLSFWPFVLQNSNPFPYASTHFVLSESRVSPIIVPRVIGQTSYQGSSIDFFFKFVILMQSVSSNAIAR